MPVLHTAMSEKDMDQMPRMKDYLKTDDLDTDACVTLAAKILADTANEYVRTRRRCDACPSRENLDHLRVCVNFYLSEFYTALSGGLVDGKAAMEALDRQARGGGNRHK